MIDYGKLTDVANAYGRVGYSLNVTVSAMGSGFEYNVDFSTPDENYDFSPTSSNPAITAFNRLQTNGYASIYKSSANFSMNYEQSI